MTSTPDTLRRTSSLIVVFRVIAVGEAVSWLCLLAGMAWAYLLTDPSDRTGIEVFGPIHGGMFTAYVVVTLLVARSRRWRASTLVRGLLASIPPVFTVVFERWAARHGHLDAPAPR